MAVLLTGSGDGVFHPLTWQAFITGRAVHRFLYFPEWYVRTLSLFMSTSNCNVGGTKLVMYIISKLFCRSCSCQVSSAF